MEKEIANSLKLANNYIEEAIKAAVEKDENKIHEMIWKASSELEYCLFLMSISIGEDNIQKIGSRSDPDPKFKGEIGPFLVSIQDLVEEAQSFLQKKLKSEAYRMARAARNGLLRLHTTLERLKKQRKRK